MSENLKLYNQFRAVPADAQKKIGGGRLNGFTDINPMWRIKALTEAFGPCGMGWKYKIMDKRTMEGTGGEVAAFVDIELSYKVGDAWSEPIPGTGGSAFIAQEKGGLRTSDECFKMALTDAISVAAKALGIGADVYWDKDRTKYTTGEAEDKPVRPAPSAPAPGQKVNVEQVPRYVKELATMTQQIWPTNTAEHYLKATGFPHPRNTPEDKAQEIKAKLAALIAGNAQ